MIKTSQSDCLYLNSLQSYNLGNKIGEMVEFSLKRKWLKLSGTNCTCSGVRDFVEVFKQQRRTDRLELESLLKIWYETKSWHLHFLFCGHVNI